MKPSGMQVWCNYPNPTHTTNWVPSSGWSCYRSTTVYIYPNDVFEVDKILFNKYIQKNQLSIPDSQPKW